MGCVWPALVRRPHSDGERNVAAGSTHETDELTIQQAILELMKDGRVWTNAELKKRLANALPWTPEELTASPKRPNEQVWENRVNNALSQTPGRPRSLYGKGHVQNVGRGQHRITEAGVRCINNDDFTADDVFTSP